MTDKQYKEPTLIDEQVRKIVREELRALLGTDPSVPLELIIRKVVRKIDAEKEMGESLEAKEIDDRYHLYYLQKILARIQNLLKMYVGSQFEQSFQPIITFQDGRQVGFGWASHLSRDPGGFKLLEFGGYHQFYQLSMERRNYFLEEGLRQFRLIVPDITGEDLHADLPDTHEPDGEQLKDINLNQLPEVEKQYHRVVQMLRGLQAQVVDPTFTISH